MIKLNELEKRSNTMRNYDVQILIYGFAKQTERVHVGFGSNNHLQTINDLMREKWDQSFELVAVNEAKGNFEFGVGKPQSKRDR